MYFCRADIKTAQPPNNGSHATLYLSNSLLGAVFFVFLLHTLIYLCSVIIPLLLILGNLFLAGL